MTWKPITQRTKQRNRQIYIQHRNGATLEHLAWQYDLDPTAISQIINRTRKDIEMSGENVQNISG